MIFLTATPILCVWLVKRGKRSFSVFSLREKGFITVIISAIPKPRLYYYRPNCGSLTQFPLLSFPLLLYSLSRLDAEILLKMIPSPLSIKVNLSKALRRFPFTSFYHSSVEKIDFTHSEDDKHLMRIRGS